MKVTGRGDVFLALATHHHLRCLADPELNHPFCHPGQHPQHVERQRPEPRRKMRKKHPGSTFCRYGFSVCSVPCHGDVMTYPRCQRPAKPAEAGTDRPPEYCDDPAHAPSRKDSSWE
jgi:hypothetical protein